MKLTRHQADVAVRRLADLQYTEMAEKGELPAEIEDPNFQEFARKLSWQIGADLGMRHLLDALTALSDLARATENYAREFADDDLNCAVNRALDNADIPGEWILRRSEPVSA